MDQCNNPPKIGIIGAGFSGMCAAIQLKKQLNIDSVTLFDENQDVGGTWLVNTYPGCACDIPSHLYSLSFEPNPNWSKAYSGQHEIWEYMQDVARKHDLYSKIKFRHKVIAAEWDEKIEKWQFKVLNMETGSEDTHVFDVLVSGVGGLRMPNWPKEFDAFKGSKMHSAEWDSSIELKDKEVAIVGSGASAVQIIPEIVDKVKKLIVYQRQAAWVVPRLQMEFPGWVKWAFSNVPGVQWGLRNVIFWSNEMYHSAFKMDTVMSKLGAKFGQFQLNRQVTDPEKKEKLTPRYRFGCKRVTPSNDYYPALDKKNVTIITNKIQKVTEDSIINEDGTVTKPEVLILATGFKVQEFFAPLKITAKGGEDLLRKWKKNSPNAYAGIATTDMPNAFILLGPNTALGHNSVVVVIECQVNWMIQVIREMLNRNARTATVKKSAQDEYMESIMENMKSTVWGATSCGSWYADQRGVITTLWPQTVLSYWNTTRKVDFSVFDFV